MPVLTTTRLRPPPASVILHTMATMTDLLREALSKAPSIRGVARETGLDHASLVRFMQGRSLRLDLADRLAEHFGIECRPPRRRKGQ